MKAFLPLLAFMTLIFSVQHSVGQNPQAKIRGSVKDASNQKPLKGANIQLLPNDTFTISNESGEFEFDHQNPGRYQIRISHIGYETVLITEIELKASRENVLQIQLSPSINLLTEVTVRGNSIDPAKLLNAHTLTIEETLRFPATFFDPARLATNFPGIANINDQANGISIRGNSPNNMAWRLEGLEIVNPNHTPNAGTFGDRITQTSGGVNMLSAQMLSNSTLFKGQMPPGYGNALAGSMDMRLRNGNNQKREYTLQAGLIGIDLSTEGPLSAKHKSSYLFNYRYSTLGIMNALGLELGDEAISFQDFSFKLNFPLKNNGWLSFFGLAGISENIFEAERDVIFWEFEKDRYDISFFSKMGTLGTTALWPTGSKALLRAGIAFSALQYERTADRLNDSFEALRLEEDLQEQQLFSTFVQQEWTSQSNDHFIVGLRSNFKHYRIFSFDKDRINALGKDNFLLFQPYVNWQTSLNQTLGLSSGIHLSYFSISKEWNLEPRLHLKWNFTTGQKLTFSYGLYSQEQLPQLYFVLDDQGLAQNLKVNKSHHFDIDHLWTLKPGLQMKTSLYYQYLYNIPVASNSLSSFSAINLLDEIVNFPLKNEGKARNMGFEWSLQRFFTDNHYFLFSASIFDAQYQGSDKKWRNTRYNARYTVSTVYGREWTWNAKKNRIKQIGLNLKMGFLGGFRETPIDLAASQELFTTIFREGQAFSLQQSPFSRLDLRFYYTIQKKGYTSTLSLDIQNVANTQNEAFRYYDLLKEQVVAKNQLGIIPIINYKLEF